MPFPMQPRYQAQPETQLYDSVEVGSETGIEFNESSLNTVVSKSDFDWLASIKRITENIVDIIRILMKWR